MRKGEDAAEMRFLLGARKRAAVKATRANKLWHFLGTRSNFPKVEIKVSSVRASSTSRQHFFNCTTHFCRSPPLGMESVRETANCSPKDFLYQFSIVLNWKCVWRAKEEIKSFLDEWTGASCWHGVSCYCSGEAYRRRNFFNTIKINDISRNWPGVKRSWRAFLMATILPVAHK